MKLVEDHYYVIGGVYADQPACKICRQFRSAHHPSPKERQATREERLKTAVNLVLALHIMQAINLDPMAENQLREALQ